MNVAVVSVFLVTIVGLAGVIVPALTRRGDRMHEGEMRVLDQKHEREMSIRDRRADTYRAILTIMRDVPEGPNILERDEARDAAVMVWLWGSSEVRRLFIEWAQIMPTAYGPDATEADRQRVLDAATAVRERMGDEVQGRVEVD